MRKNRTFFWQGALILLPLVLLLAFGIYSLRQDRAMAEIEAKERCRQTASELLRPLATRWSDHAQASEHDFRITIDSAGNLISIADSKTRAQTPPQPKPLILDVGSLSSSAAHLWQQAREAEFTTNGLPQTAMLYLQFLSQNPPQPFASIGKYSLALNLHGSPSGLFEKDRYLSQLQTNKEAVSEAGLPLHLLAGLQRVELAAARLESVPAETNLFLLTNVLLQLCTDAVKHPSLVTPVVLERVAELEKNVASDKRVLKVANGEYRNITTTWQNEWNQDEEAREFYREAASGLHANPRPGSFWLMWQGSPHLVVVTERFDTSLTTRPLNDEERSKRGGKKTTGDVPEVHTTGTGTFNVRCMSEDAVRATIVNLEKQEGPRLPDYAEAAYKVGDRWLIGGSSKDPLGSEWSSSLQGAFAPVTVVVHVARPQLLYARQRQRTWWFGGLIAISGFAACIGLVSAHRGFHQQRRLNEMKSNFVSSVSHELRAPIASVRLLAEALDRGAVSEQPKQKEYFRFIVQECRRLTGLIENVLDFSRIEQGRKSYQFEETDLNALVDQTVKLMKPMAEERGVHLEISDSQPSTLNSQLICDGLAVQQALVNLIDNAVKHSPSGQIVTIALESNPSSIQLSVTDNGPGIPPKDHEKIFERFYRRGSELRRETQGIGIGLTIVKHVAEAHGGRVIVASEVGRGSKFTIELPNQSVDPKHEARNPKSETNPNI